MSTSSVVVFNPKLDLVLERTTDASIEQVWSAWTEPERIKRWFTPAPWTTEACEIDLRPGGIFRTVMRSPEGHEMDNSGCFLEVIPHQRLVWTGALGPGFRPKAASAEIPFLMTAIIELAQRDGMTLYTATVLHADEASRSIHEKMGFYHGWGAAFDQLVSMYERD